MALRGGLVAGDAAALCVAGVALMAIYLRFAWQAWRLETFTFILRGKQGTYGTAWRAWTAWSPVTLRHFAWQAWPSATSTFVLRGMVWHLVTATFAVRGRRGTWRHPPSFHVAGVALGDIHLRFAWQAWHLWHCVARLDGLVAGDAAAFCVAGVALMAIHLRFTWQAWHLVTSTFVLRGRRGTCRHPPSLCVAGVALIALRGALGRLGRR